jgi:CRP-like cAMP-binding protein
MNLPEELDTIPFFQELGGPYAEQLGRLARLKEHPAGAVIFRQGQDAPFVSFVLAGEVGLDVPVSSHEVAEVHRVGPGEILGWSPMLGMRAMTATARAATPVRLAILDVDQVVSLCERDPVFGTAFHRQVALVLSARLDDTRRRLSRHLTRRPIPAEGSD